MTWPTSGGEHDETFATALGDSQGPHVRIRAGGLLLFVLLMSVFAVRAAALLQSSGESVGLLLAGGATAVLVGLLFWAMSREGSARMQRFVAAAQARSARAVVVGLVTVPSSESLRRELPDAGLLWPVGMLGLVAVQEGLELWAFETSAGTEPTRITTVPWNQVTGFDVEPVPQGALEADALVVRRAGVPPLVLVLYGTGGLGLRKGIDPRPDAARLTAVWHAG